jgi:hypothetical protein
MAIDSYTKFLSHWNGLNGSYEIQDSGNTGHIVTSVNGANTSTTQTKIGSSSLSLNGTTQYLTVPDHADWDFGSSNFSLECFIYLNALPPDASQFVIATHHQDDNNCWFWTLRNESGTYYLRWVDYNTGFSIDVKKSWGSTPNTGQWYHIAITRATNDFKMYVDAVQIGTTEVSATAVTNKAGLLYIGAFNNTPDYAFNGYIDELRISNTNRTITVPTSAYTSDSNTKLLLHMESLEIATNKPLTFAVTAQLSTAQKKFGSASLLLDGNSDYVSVPDSDDWNLSNGLWTADFWVKHASDAGSQTYFGQFAGGAYWRCLAEYNAGDGKISFTESVAGGIFHTTNDVAADDGSWHHIAIVRTSTNNDQSSMKVFVDGVSKALTYDANMVTLPDLAGVFRIGDDGNGNYMNGYIDEFRFSKGVARWTADFTPPTSEYSSALTRSFGIIL